MESSILPLFSVPLYQSHTGKQDFSKEIDHLKSIEFLKANHNQVSKNVRLFEDPILKNCLDICLTHLNLYVSNTFNCKQNFYITNSWAAISKPGEKHHTHFHPNSIISGVLYLQTSSLAGDLVLHHKSTLQQGFDFSYDINSYNLFNSTTWNLTPDTGDIIIFPSWLNHSVDENNWDKERIIIGFNTFVKGEFGENEYSAGISL